MCTLSAVTLQLCCKNTIKVLEISDLVLEKLLKSPKFSISNMMNGSNIDIYSSCFLMK